MTPEQLAGYLQIPTSSVYAKTRKGGLPAIKIGRMYRYRKEDVDEWLDQQKVRKEGKNSDLQPKEIVKDILKKVLYRGHPSR
jgi:excisionase family DNA binding protein